MGVLVVYESMFGNTKRIAEAIAEGIGEQAPVELVEVSEAPLAIDPGVDLLVAGGPTHVHGMTTARTRASAVERSTGPLVSGGIGMREWLEQLGHAAGHVRAAAFDTRINGPKVLTGSAAGSNAKHLRGAGYEVVSEHSFLVTAKAPQPDDAIVAGELDAARAWGRSLGARIPIKV